MFVSCNTLSEERKFLQWMRLPGSREFPRIAVYMSVIGLVMQVFSAAVIYFLPSQEFSPMSQLMGTRGMAAAFIIMGHSNGTALSSWFAATVTFLAVGLVSVLLLATSRQSLVRIGAGLLIVLALVSGTTTFGLILGSIRMFASGVAGITWSYSRSFHF